MKIKEIKLNKFKRFTDLTITDIPETAKLIVMVGPNGCGKTSVFEGFNLWQKFKGYGNIGDKGFYLKENDVGEVSPNERISISTYGNAINNRDEIRESFYFRTAHRNEPNFSFDTLKKQDDPKAKVRLDTLDKTDSTVSENYQRLVSSTVSGIFNRDNDNKKVKDLRDEIIGKINASLTQVFDDLALTTIGDPATNGSFYFTKGTSLNFHYKNLSAGEKAAFDLLLDIVVKSIYYKNTVYCIDEPELHMHTSLQARLLSEMYRLIPDNSQLWLATHSIGMLEKAREINEANPNTVCFIDFADSDFDNTVILRSSDHINKAIWNRFVELAFGDFAKLVAPRTIVFCEGNPQGRKNKNFDSQVYQRIFSSRYPNTSFVSVGSCEEIIKPDNVSMLIIKEILNASNKIQVVDRDSRSDQEVRELNAKGIKVLRRRHLECYLFDKEIIEKLCASEAKVEKLQECLIAKESRIQESISRGNPPDDIKSAGGDIYNDLKRILGLTRCGNNAISFLRDTMAPLVTEDTQVYKELKREIFGNE